MKSQTLAAGGRGGRITIPENKTKGADAVVRPRTMEKPAVYLRRTRPDDPEWDGELEPREGEDEERGLGRDPEERGE